MRLPALSAMPLFVAVLLGGCASSQNTARSVSGTWTYTIYDTPEGDLDGELRLDVPGGSLSGEITNELAARPAPLQQVGLEDQALSFSATFNIQGDTYNTSTSAALSGDRMEGTMNVDGVGTYRFAATRAGGS